MVNNKECKTGRLISFYPNFFKIYGEKNNLEAVVGTNGSYIIYKSENKDLSNILHQYIGKIKDGLYGTVDDTNYFMLTSLKRCIENLKYRCKYSTSEILSEKGQIERIVEDIYDNR
jgi:hypothetical protein